MKVFQLDWYYYNSYDIGPHVVGAEKKPNQWGFYNMHGNVSEFCRDCYEEYPSTEVNDPIGTSGNTYVYRGGYYASTQIDCRSAKRFYSAENTFGTNIGFRLALVPIE